MNREEAKVVARYIRECESPVAFGGLVEAFAAGADVQIRVKNTWQSWTIYSFDKPFDRYRVNTPPPTVRPFKNGLEAMTALASNGHWLKRKGQSEWCLVTRVRDMGLTIMGRVYGFEELLDKFEFKNGPCGIEQ